MCERTQKEAKLFPFYPTFYYIFWVFDAEETETMKNSKTISSNTLEHYIISRTVADTSVKNSTQQKK